jgi:hypothetical protein
VTVAELIQKGALARLMAQGVAGVATVAAPSPDSVRDWWGERAAIMEHDGGVPRRDAEHLARIRTLAHFNLPPDHRLH